MSDRASHTTPTAPSSASCGCGLFCMLRMYVYIVSDVPFLPACVICPVHSGFRWTPTSHLGTLCIVRFRAKLVASNRTPDVPGEGDSMLLPASTSSSSWAHSIPLPEKGAVLMAHPLQFTDSQVGTGLGGRELRTSSHRVLMRECVNKDSPTRCLWDTCVCQSGAFPKPLTGHRQSVGWRARIPTTDASVSRYQG